MKLSSLLKNLRFRKIQGTLRKEITGIYDHSGKCQSGGIFVAVSGRDFDGHFYLQEAVENGAIVCIVERLPGISYHKPEQVTILLVSDTRKALAIIAGNFYSVNYKKMKLIGITGTKGKTSVAFMIREGFLQAGISVGMIGSNGAYINDRFIETENTTPGALELFRLLYGMEEEGCSYVIMEVSSQSVMQRRIYQVPFLFGIFTNFAPDHIGLGEHASLEEYFFWKSKFMEQADCQIVNDCLCLTREGKGKQPKVCYTFGLDKNSDLRITQVQKKRSDCAFWTEAMLVAKNWEEKILLPFPFAFQILNAAAAWIVLMQCGVPGFLIRESMMRIGIPGRCEWVYGEKSRYIMIDYAHNAYSMEALLSEFREFAGLNIISLFGCGGCRSVLRRKEMGKVSGTYADLTIITEDNSRSESPEKIMDEVCQGVKESKGKYLIYKERRDAIRQACTYLKEHTILLILGKGREQYMETAEGKIPYSDYETIQRIQMEGGI